MYAPQIGGFCLYRCSAVMSQNASGKRTERWRQCKMFRWRRQPMLALSLWMSEQWNCIRTSSEFILSTFNRTSPWHPKSNSCKYINDCFLFLLTVVHLCFNVGSEVKLNCSDVSWGKLMYVIWKVDLAGHKQCQVGNSSIEGEGLDTCADGKSLRSVSESHFYLHIPNFSERDVGMYRCETAFRGGSHTCNISVSITGTT